MSIGYVDPHGDWIETGDWSIDPVVYQRTRESSEYRMNIRRTIETLQSAPASLLRMSELTALHTLSLRLETVEYQAVVQALYEMLQHGVYPQHVFLAPQIYTAFCAIQDEAQCKDHLAISGRIDGKEVQQAVQFAGVPGLDEHLVLFGFFK